MRSVRPTGHDLRFGRAPGEHRWLSPPLAPRGRNVASSARPRQRTVYEVQANALPRTGVPILRPISNGRTARRWNPLPTATPTTMDIDPEFRNLGARGWEPAETRRRHTLLAQRRSSLIFSGYEARYHSGPIRTPCGAATRRVSTLPSSSSSPALPSVVESRALVCSGSVNSRLVFECPGIRSL